MMRRRAHHCIVAQHILRAPQSDRKATRVGAASWMTMKQLIVHITLRRFAA